MKAQDLLELSEFADQVLMGLVELGRSVSDERFADQPNEAMANYLSNLKAGMQGAVESLSTLARRCQSAELLWRMQEEQEASLELMRRQNDELARVLAMPIPGVRTMTGPITLYGLAQKTENE